MRRVVLRSSHWLRAGRAFFRHSGSSPAGLSIARCRRRGARRPSRSDSVLCFDCDPRQKHFWTASAQLVGAMLVPWSYNKFVRGSDFADVNPGTWWDNITGEWVWDDNTFTTNQFAHPYHGSLYFNAFRTNATASGSRRSPPGQAAFLWECCGETNPPAPTT